MKRIFLICAVVFSLIFTACEYQDVEMVSLDDYKLENVLTPSEPLYLTIDATLKNPNNYKITVKKAEFRLKIAGKDMGPVHLETPVVMKKNSSEAHEIRLRLDNNKVLKALKGSAWQMLTKGEVDVEVKGRLKGKVMGIGKWFDIKHKESMRIKDLMNG